MQVVLQYISTRDRELYLRHSDDTYPDYVGYEILKHHGEAVLEAVVGSRFEIDCWRLELLRESIESLYVVVRGEKYHFNNYGNWSNNAVPPELGVEGDVLEEILTKQSEKYKKNRQHMLRVLSGGSKH